MMHSPDINRIAGALDLLARTDEDNRLSALKNLAINNGIWTIPDAPWKREPVLYEVSLFGVPASASDPGELPLNWMRAARNILERLDGWAA